MPYRCFGRLLDRIAYTNHKIFIEQHTFDYHCNEILQIESASHLSYFSKKFLFSIIMFS